MKVLKAWVVVASLWLLTGCSAFRVVYDTGPTLAWWWIDGYGDFTGEQATRVKDGIRSWFDWHRTTQLEGYAAWLAGPRAKIGESVTPAQMCAWYGEARRLLDDIADHPVDRRVGAEAEAVLAAMFDQAAVQQRRREGTVVHGGDAQAAPHQLPGPAAGRRAEVDGAHARTQQRRAFLGVEEGEQRLFQLERGAAGCTRREAQPWNAHGVRAAVRRRRNAYVGGDGGQQALSPLMWGEVTFRFLVGRAEQRSFIQLGPQAGIGNWVGGTIGQQQFLGQVAQPLDERFEGG